MNVSLLIGKTGICMTPPLSSLRCFEVASRSANFSEAANILCLTPSAVSHQIKLLERYLGQPLFVRDQRRMRLTEAGRIYASRMGPVFREIESATAALQNRVQDTRLVIWIPPSLASSWLVPQLADFFRLHPSIAIQLITDNTKNAPAPHCEIRYGHGKWPNAKAYLLWTETLKPMVSPNGPVLASIDDLVRAPLIHTRSRSVGWQKFFETHNLSCEAYEAGLFFDRTGNAMDAATAGLGVTLESPILARRLVREGRLSIPLGELGVPDESYYLIVSPGEAPEETFAFRQWALANLPVL